MWHPKEVKSLLKQVSRGTWEIMGANETLKG